MRPPRRLARCAIQPARAMPMGPATIAGGSGAMGLSLFSFNARWRRMEPDRSTAGGGTAGSSLDPPSGGKVPPPLLSSCGSCNTGVVEVLSSAAADAGAADRPITETSNKARADAHREALGADRKPRRAFCFRSEIRITTTPKPTTARPAELNPLRPVWSSGIGVSNTGLCVRFRKNGELWMR